VTVCQVFISEGYVLHVEKCVEMFCLSDYLFEYGARKGALWYQLIAYVSSTCFLLLSTFSGIC
jgi:hypothetical protein